MGFEKHPQLREPSDGTKLWRYMDLGKFLDILTTESLAFPVATKMSDPYEGELGLYNKQMPHPYTGFLPDEGLARLQDKEAWRRRNMRKYTFLSCWHASPHESAAMWSLYASEDKGVAVVTTWGRLKASLDTDVMVFGGEVRYLDYRTQAVPDGNSLPWYLHKRISFAHEQEVRLIAQDMLGEIHDLAPDRSSVAPDQLHPLFRKALQDGVARVPTAPDALIEEVRVAPRAQSWFADVVTSVSAKYGGLWSVEQSDLYELP